MKQYYKKLSFLRKLTVINFSVGIPAVLIIILIGVSFVKNEGKKTINRQLTQISILTAEMVVSDILFNDGEAIEETLKKLSVFPTIKYACIINNEREIIATYGNNNIINQAQLIDGQENYYVNDNIVIYNSIKFKKQKLGRLAFISNISPLLLLINKIILGLIVVLCLVFGFWLLLSINLQKFLLKPLIVLSKTMDDVVKTGKYDVNLKYESYEDEVGHLYNDFNQLMRNISAKPSKILSK